MKICFWMWRFGAPVTKAPYWTLFWASSFQSVCFPNCPCLHIFFFQPKWRVLLRKFLTYFHSPLSINMLWTDPNEIPSMLPTSRIVILLFLMTTALSWSTILCVWLVHVHPECAESSTVTPLLSWENHSENCIIPIIWSPNLPSTC